MIKLTYNNKPIYLADNAKINITEVNPLFVRDKNSTSLQFKIPYHGNEEALEYIKLNYQTNELKNVELSYGTFFMRGILKINELSENITAVFKPNQSFSLKDEKTLISDLPYKTYDISESSSSNRVNTLPEDGGEIHNFALWWNKFFDTTWLAGDPESINNSINDDPSKDDVLFPFISAFFNILFQKQNFFIKENDIETHASSFVRQLVFIANTTTLNNHKPTELWKIPVKGFFEKVTNALNIIFIVDDLEKSVRIKFGDNLIAQNPVDITQHCGPVVFKHKDKQSGYYVKLGQPIGEEFADQVKDFNADIDGELADAVATVADLPTTDPYKTIRFVEYDSTYYRYVKVQDTSASTETWIDTWEIYSHIPVNYLKGTTEKPFTLESSLYPALDFKATDWDYLFVRLNSQGNSRFHYEESELQLFYAEMRSGGSPGIYAPFNSGKYTHQLLHEKTANFFTNSIPGEMEIDPQVFLIHDMYSKFFAHGYTFFIREKSVDFTQKGLSKCKCKIQIQL